MPALLGAASERWAAVAAAAAEGSLGSASGLVQGLVIICVLAAACDEEELLSSLRPLQPLDRVDTRPLTHTMLLSPPLGQDTGHTCFATPMKLFDFYCP